MQCQFDISPVNYSDSAQTSKSNGYNGFAYKWIDSFKMLLFIYLFIYLFILFYFIILFIYLLFFFYK